MLAEKVGTASYINQMTASAKTFRVVLTPMQRDINRVIHLMVLISIILALLTLSGAIVQSTRIHEVMQAIAVIAGLVPYLLRYLRSARCLHPGCAGSAVALSERPCHRTGLYIGVGEPGPSCVALCILPRSNPTARPR